MASVFGADRVWRKLKKLGDAAPMTIAKGLYEAAETIMRDAKERTPVDTGNLKASGHVEPTTRERAIRGTAVRFELGFGGPAGAGNQGETNTEDVGYAVYVHEHGPRVGGVGERKFLENAARAQTPQIPRIVAKWVEREIRRRGVA